MPTPFSGTVEVQDEKTGLTNVTLDGDNGKISVGRPSSTQLIGGAAPGQTQTKGIPGQNGAIDVVGIERQTAVSLGVYSDGSGTISLTSSEDKQQAFLGRGNLNLGGNGSDGTTLLFPKDANDAPGSTVPAKPTVVLRSSSAFVGAGGRGTNGHMGLFPAAASDADAPLTQAAIHLDTSYGSQAVIRAGVGPVGQGAGIPGHILVTRDGGATTVDLWGEDGYIGVGGHTTQGQIGLFPPTATNIEDLTHATIHLGASYGGSPQQPPGGSPQQPPQGIIRVGVAGIPGRIQVTGNDGKTTVDILGASGDIVLSNGDCAEEFDATESELVEPGTVMVLDGTGKIATSCVAYDPKVAGVVSGAGDYKPAIVLDKRETGEIRIPLALVGKVYCKVDAQHSPVEVGDLLTTSEKPGYAMKAVDRSRAFGAVIGKALRPLKDGQGLLPILIALQ
jgi:hypothetical protein